MQHRLDRHRLGNYRAFFVELLTPPMASGVVQGQIKEGECAVVPQHEDMVHRSVIAASARRAFRGLTSPA